MMLNNSPGNNTLHKTISDLLKSVFQENTVTQWKLAQNINKIQVIEEYPLVLCDIVCNSSEDLPKRHLASVFLKNYLRELFFEERENTAFYTKDYGKIIGSMLLNCMDSENENIKKMITCSLALLLAIGCSSDLTLQLSSMIESQNPNVIHNALMVLTEAISKEYVDSESQHFIDQRWFDIFLHIFQMTNIKSVTRALSIQPMISIMKLIENPTTAYFEDCWRKISIQFDMVLREPYSIHCDYYLKGEIIKCLYDNIDEFKEYCVIFLPPILPHLGNLLSYCCEIFKDVVSGSGPLPKDEHEPADDEPTNFIQLIENILNILLSIIDTIYFDMFIDDLESLLYCIFIFMACYDEMEDQLYMELNEKGHWFAIRDICCEIIRYSKDKLEDIRPEGKLLFFRNLNNVFQKLSNELEATVEINMRGVYYMTRILESMIFGLGTIEETFTEVTAAVFPIGNYIRYWTTIMQNTDSVFLNARIIWISGVYCTNLSPDLMEYFFKIMMMHCNGENKCFLVSSVEAICNYFKSFNHMDNTQKYVISSFAEQVIPCLVTAIQKEESFFLNDSLNSLAYFVKIFRSVASDNIELLEDVLIKVINQFISNVIVMKEVNFLVAALAQDQHFKISVHDKFLNFLFRFLQNCTTPDVKIHTDKILDLLNTFALNCPIMDELLVLQLFIDAVNFLYKSESDIEVEKMAVMLLATLIIKQHNNLELIKKPSKNESIIVEFPKIITTLLGSDGILPAHVCDKLVVIILVSFPGLMEPHIISILKNVITSSCKRIQNVIPTWIIFAFICMLKTSDTLHYLSILPGPNGGSALSYMMKNWRIDYITSLDNMERKILVFSITHIIQNCIENESNYLKMTGVSLQFEKTKDDEVPIKINLNAMEYLYMIVMEFLFFEHKQLTKLSAGLLDVEDAITPFEDQILFNGHVLDIDIMNHIVTYLKIPTESYFSIIRKLYMPKKLCLLRDLGCCIPGEDLTVEKME